MKTKKIGEKNISSEKKPGLDPMPEIKDCFMKFTFLCLAEWDQHDTHGEQKAVDEYKKVFVEIKKIAEIFGFVDIVDIIKGRVL